MLAVFLFFDCTGANTRPNVESSGSSGSVSDKSTAPAVSPQRFTAAVGGIEAAAVFAQIVETQFEAADVTDSYSFLKF